MSVNWRDHCNVKAFGLDHDNGMLFVTSQWSSRPISVLLYAIYQTIIVVFLFAVLVYAPISHNLGAKFLIFLTYWGFLSLFGCFIFRCCTAWLCYFLGIKKACTDSGSIPWYLKVQWIFYNLATNTGAIISVLYWGLVYEGYLSFGNFCTHGANIIIIIMDLFITAHPVRILHFYQTMTLAFLYSLFVGVYWAARGTDEFGNPYIYAYFDFDKVPGLASGLLVLLVLVAAPVAHCVIFIIYQVRLLLLRKCGGGNQGLQEESADPGEMVCLA